MKCPSFFLVPGLQGPSQLIRQTTDSATLVMWFCPAKDRTRGNGLTQKYSEAERELLDLEQTRDTAGFLEEGRNYLY